MSQGDILAGKYQVDRVLGAGGMGVVVAATHVQLGHRVALKFMLPSVAENQEANERFLREARAAAKLKSEYIARVSDVGTLDNGAPYIVMDYLEGMDLAGFLVRKGRLPAEEAVLYVMQSCAGMAEAHTHGIVHRDLKPENLFLTKHQDGTPIVKVLDFGVSKAGAASGEVSTTKSGVAMGSPAFMAPEQMRSAKDVNEKADIWSLGAILFQLLSGTLPFQSETVAEMFAQVLTMPPGDLAVGAPDSPPGLRDVVYRCLEKEPSMRMSSVVELAIALAPYGGEHGQRLALSVEGMYPGEVRKIRDSGAYPGAGPASSVVAHERSDSQAAPSVGDSRDLGFVRTTLGQSVGDGHAPVAAMQTGSTSKSRVPLVAGVGLLLAVGIGVGVSMQGDSGASSQSPAPAAASSAPAPVEPVEPAETPAVNPVTELEESLEKEREARLKAEAHSREMEAEKKAEHARLEAEQARLEAAEAKLEAERKARKARSKTRPRTSDTKKSSTKKKPKLSDDSDPFGSID